MSESKESFENTIGDYASDPAQEVGQLTLQNGTNTRLSNGDVAIASITSCTNTSNPSVMLAAGLLAKKAVAKGLGSKPWVKTSMAQDRR